MSNNLRLWSTLAAGAVCAISLSSCDPYYYSGSGYYSSGSGYSDYGYGAGYGYGNPGFSTSFFVSTGSPRWGYDPYTYCYYDYTRRCYYDPYLYGYYPAGYRPYAVVGVPHPHGYRSNYCPPPVRVTNVHLSNYQNRATAYRGTSHSWAHQVRQQPYSPPQTRPGSSSDRYRQQPNHAQPGYYQSGSQGSPAWRGQDHQQPNYIRGGGFQQPAQGRQPGSGRQPNVQPGLPPNYRVPANVPQTQPAPTSQPWRTNARQKHQDQSIQRPVQVPSAPQHVPQPRIERPASMPTPQPRIERPAPMPAPQPRIEQPAPQPQPSPAATPPSAPNPAHQPVRRGLRSLGEG
jgi:hypothetical protein